MTAWNAPQIPADSIAQKAVAGSDSETETTDAVYFLLHRSTQYCVLAKRLPTKPLLSPFSIFPCFLPIATPSRTVHTQTTTTLYKHVQSARHPLSTCLTDEQLPTPPELGPVSSSSGQRKFLPLKRYLTHLACMDSQATIHN